MILLAVLLLGSIPGNIRMTLFGCMQILINGTTLLMASVIDAKFIEFPEYTMWALWGLACVGIPFSVVIWRNASCDLYTS